MNHIYEFKEKPMLQYYVRPTQVEECNFFARLNVLR